MYKKTIVLVSIAAAMLLGSIIFFEQTTKPALAQPPPTIQFETQVKFLCGVIEEPLKIGALKPPLGQGEYRTAINVLNPDESKWDQPRKITWKAVQDYGAISIFTERLLDPNAAQEIDCTDIRIALGTNAPFIKGFVVIRQVIPLPDPIPQDFPIPKTIDVKTAYTYEVVKNKIVFEVSRDPSGKVPAQDLKTPLEIVVLKNSTTVTNADITVRNFLKAIVWNGLTSPEIDALTIKITDVELGVGSSLQVVGGRQFT